MAETPTEFDSRLGAYVRGVIAKYLNVEPDAIETFDFVASPGHRWSEHTAEPFDCNIKVTLVGGETKRVWLDEDATCEFLNGWAKSASAPPS